MVFPCLADFDGCRRLMTEIAGKPGFLPEATWLVVRSHHLPGRVEYCGTVQGVCDQRGVGAIQNLGVVAEYRRNGLGTGLLLRALAGFRQTGVRRVYLEVTAQNDSADPPLSPSRIHHCQSRLQNHRSGIRQVTHPIFSHQYPNGLVLVAEPIDALQSAAFTFLGAGRLRLRPGRSRRLEQFHLRNGPARRRRPR